ncbi:hypothetical protein HPT28_24230 [Streptomyces sp. JJ38]|nr:hypothetical protein [Streptomyces sp. JJ38]
MTEVASDAAIVGRAGRTLDGIERTAGRAVPAAMTTGAVGASVATTAARDVTTTAMATAAATTVVSVGRIVGMTAGIAVVSVGMTVGMTEAGSVGRIVGPWLSSG